MSDRYRQVRRALCSIYQDIWDYAYDHYSLPLEWESGEVFITTERPRASLKSPRLTIVTPGAREIAWLLNGLGQAFSGLLSSASQTKFYARLARLIQAHEMSSARPYRVNSILKSVIDEAFTMLDEMETREREPSRSIAAGAAVNHLQPVSISG